MAALCYQAHSSVLLKFVSANNYGNNNNNNCYVHCIMFTYMLCVL